VADNTTIDAGSGGDVIATDDIGGVKYQRVKISQGADGSATDVGIGGGTEATALRVTVASDSTGVVSVDDNGSTLSIDDGGGNISIDDGGNTITVDGTVTANLGATDTAALAAIETAVEILDNAISGSEMQVDIVSAPTITVDSELTTADLDTGAGTDTRAVVGLAGTASGGAQLIPGSSTDGLLVNLGTNNDVTVSGVATAANQTTVIGHLDGVEGLLTTIDADTSNLSVVGGGTEAAAIRVTIASDSTGVLSIDDNGAAITVDGTVTANLAAGTNNIGDVDVLSLPALPAGTNNIGDVDVASVVPGTAATNLGKAEDAAHASGDVGVMSLAVRADAAASIAGTDGDYTPLQVDANGALRVTGGGGGTEYTVDAAAPAAPTGATFVMERDDALAALTEIEGDWTNPRSNANGALWVKHDGDVTVTGVSTAANQTTIIGHLDGVEGLLTTIDGDTGTLAAAVAGTEMQVDVVGALPAGNNNIGDVDVASVVPGTAATSLGKAEDGAHTTGDTGVAILGVRRDTAASGADTDGDYATLNLDSTGRLWTRDPLAITELTSIKTAVETLDNTVAGTELQVDVVAALPAGTNAIGKLAANSGVDIGDVDVTSISAGTNTIGDVGIKPRTSGGYTIFRSIDLDETEEEVKATAGQVFGWYIFNAAATTHYVKFYNATTANVTVGTTTPVLTIPVPAGSAANVFTDTGIAFGTAITAAATTGVADNDTGAPAANAVVVNVFYS
jgi:hypothetical protein